MPPNRKLHSHIADRQEDLRGFVAAPFKADATIVPQENSRSNATTIDSDSYWNWKSKTENDMIVDRIVEEERIRELFTVDHITTNLIKESQRQHGESKDAESSDYWDMPAQSEMPTEEAVLLTSANRMESNLCKDAVRRAQNEAAPTTNHNVYWEWPEETKEERMIRNILEDKRARNLVDVERIEKHLEERAIPKEGRLLPEHDSYWAM